ncbi:MAG: outer membrane beta-barrel protein, partial [Niastella sp.]|uniref:outer membrane beta-barrel protein n=1 Tax=Niastella sp. TaxID=1869183 RepID=UPI00389AB624
MKSKVLLIALATTVFALGAKAQDKTTFGVRAGLNFQNITGDDGDGHKYDNKLKTGINIGLNAEIPIAEDFYIQPGLLFATKGAKDDNYRKINVRLSYLEIPINLLFKPELGDG